MKTIISTTIIALLSCISFVYAQQNTDDKKSDNATYYQAKKVSAGVNPISKTENSGKKDKLIKEIPTENNTPVSVSPHPAIQVETHVEQHEALDTNPQPDCTTPKDAIEIQLSSIQLINSSVQYSDDEKAMIQKEISEEYTSEKIQFKLADEHIIYVVFEGECINTFSITETHMQQIIVRVNDDDAGDSLLYEMKFTHK